MCEGTQIPAVLEYQLFCSAEPVRSGRFVLEKVTVMFTRLMLMFLILSAAHLMFPQQQSERTMNRQALVQMEKAFAKVAATKGTRDAFLEFLADDGIVFQPGPVNGKKYWSERQPAKGLLSWQPAFADVSRAGDLGYTTGAWEYRPNGPQDQPVAFGQYFTIWKKQSDGAWKAALDRGVSTEKPYPARVVLFPMHDESSTSETNFDVARGKASLLKLEDEFSALSIRKGTSSAFDSYLADGARILRPNTAPAIDKNNAMVLISGSVGTLTLQPVMADVSASEDMGYTYGAFELKNPGITLEHGSYVRVWKKHGRDWRVVMDVRSPDPEK
jgi:ketosteroid isomerase-like protein